jgi:hypothetical protein
MRVIDIISQDLNEGKISTPVEFIWDLFLKSEGRAAAREAVAATEAVTKAAVKKGAPLTPAEMERLGIKPELRNNPQWTRQTEDNVRIELAKRAPKPKPIKEPTATAKPATVKGALSAAGLWTNKATSVLSMLAAVGISVAPFYNYNKMVDMWKAKLDAGELPGGQTQFEELRQKEMSIAVTTFAASLTGFFAIKSVGRGSSWLLGWIPGFKPLMSVGTTVGGVALEEWLLGDEGRKLIARAFAEEIFKLDEILGAPVIHAIDLFKDKIKDVVPQADNNIRSDTTLTPADKARIDATSAKKPDQSMPSTDPKTQEYLKAYGFKQTPGTGGGFNFKKN